MYIEGFFLSGLNLCQVGYNFSTNIATVKDNTKRS